MFGKIRQKINNVIQDGLTLSENISNAYLKPSNRPNSDSDNTLGIPTDINLRAGSSILEQNEFNWKEIHDLSEINAKKADEVDRTITRVKDRTDKLYVDLNDLCICLAGIPKIEETLNSCFEMIDAMGKQYQNLEIKFVELQDLMEEVDLQERQLQHKFQISMYKQKKMGELENVRLKLVDQHEENVRKYENELRKKQLERQEVFQSAFQTDLEIYKEQGSVPKLEHFKSNQQEVPLEEIVLDEPENNNDLEKFLNE